MYERDSPRTHLRRSLDLPARRSAHRPRVPRPLAAPALCTRRMPQLETAAAGWFSVAAEPGVGRANGVAVGWPRGVPTVHEARRTRVRRESPQRHARERCGTTRVRKQVRATLSQSKRNVGGHLRCCSRCLTIPPWQSSWQSMPSPVSRHHWHPSRGHQGSQPRITALEPPKAHV